MYQTRKDEIGMKKLFKTSVYIIGFVPIILFAIPIGLVYGTICAPKAFIDGWKEERKKHLLKP